jgi:alkylation response protein AidB-like acyl-CoA dehydrogenase
MYMQFTDSEEAFRTEIRDFLKKELPQNWDGLTKEEFASDEGWAFYKEFTHKLAAKGWLQLHWPPEYGGQGASPMKMAIFVEEMTFNQAPIVPEAGWIGPTIMLHGSEEQKKKYLPGLASGETELCIGYTEPDAGSDLFSLRTKADEDDDHYIINGQKIFTSLAHRADYCFLAARTDPNLPKHAGISIFLVDMNIPGIMVRPLIDMGGTRMFNEVFFDNVRVPKNCLLGKKNGGLAIIITELNIERASGGGVDIAARGKQVLNGLIKYAYETERNNQRLSKDPLIRHQIAERAVEIEVTRMLAYRVVWLQSKGIIAQVEASASKVYGSEMQQRLANTGAQVMGLYSGLKTDPKWAPLARQIWNQCLLSFVWLIAGGTNEIQRNIIASYGLGLQNV